MPNLQSERITSVKWADSQAVKDWRDKARIMAMSALSLANNPDYVVYGVRNSKATLLGLAAIREYDTDVILLHLATRDEGRGIGKLLIDEINLIYGKRIKTVPEKGAGSFYKHIGWRKVGNEYWSK